MHSATTESELEPGRQARKKCGARELDLCTIHKGVQCVRPFFVYVCAAVHERDCVAVASFPVCLFAFEWYVLLFGERKRALVLRSALVITIIITNNTAIIITMAVVPSSSTEYIMRSCDVCAYNWPSTAAAAAGAAFAIVACVHNKESIRCAHPFRLHAPVNCRLSIRSVYIY